MQDLHENWKFYLIFFNRPNMAKQLPSPTTDVTSLYYYAIDSSDCSFLRNTKLRRVDILASCGWPVQRMREVICRGEYQFYVVDCALQKEIGAQSDVTIRTVALGV